MADYFPAFDAELKAFILGVLGFDDSRYYSSIQALQQNLVEGVIKSTVTLPIVVVLSGRLTPETDSGVAAKAKRATVDIWIVDKLEDRGATSNQSYLHSLAFAVGEAIDDAVPNLTPGVTTFQAFDEDATIDSSASNAANQLFLELKVKLLAAVVSYPRGLLVGTV